MESIKHRLEILNSSYWEHFKFAKDLAGYLDYDHPKRIKIENLLNEMVDEIHKLNQEIKDMHPQLSWLEHLFYMQGVLGSNPSGCTNVLKVIIEYSKIVDIYYKTQT